ncbi:MAG: TatD family hydrolase [bacterium]
MIDTHAHLDFEQFDNDREEVIQRAFDGGVKKIVNIGCNLERAKKAIELAEKYKDIYAVVGIHPTDAAFTSDFVCPNVGADLCIRTERAKNYKNSEQNFDRISARSKFNPEFKNGTNIQGGHAGPPLREKLREFTSHPKVVAIGEIGLDYFHLDNSGRNAAEILEGEIENSEETRPSLELRRAQQKELFIAQLELAQELNLPVIIHCRDAYEDVLAILGGWVKKNPLSHPLKKGANGFLPLSEGEIKRGCVGVIHCFSGNLEQAKKFLDLGFYISFTGNITYCRGGKSSASTIENVVREVPLEKMMVETDCPFLAPAPMRGRRNEPLFVKYVAEKIAEIKKINTKDVEKETDENARKLFEI